VLPAFFYGTGGGHVNYKWTIILPEEQIRPILETTLDQLAAFGFKVVVILTGHYPREQVEMVHRLAEEAARRSPGTRYIGLSVPEVTTPLPGDRRRGDHAAKYETSIGLALNPDWVKMDQLRPDHDPDRVTLPDTPRTDRPTHDPAHPLYAIYGDDPRATASEANGQKLVDEIVRSLSEKVEEALTALSD
jgi:creatinine amidohydrolase